MSSLPKAARFLRSLRGGCQAKLVQATDGEYYAIKSTDNPQGGRRILVNEYLGSRVLGKMGISVAQSRPVEVTGDFIEASPEMLLRTANGRRPHSAGVYLGSRYEVSPETSAIFDFLPTAIAPRISNVADFAGALVADLWFSNADARQCVFHRIDAPLKSLRPYRAVMIDCGRYLNGPEWHTRPSPLTGTCFQSDAYRSLRSVDFERYIEAAGTIDETLLRTWIDELPVEWLRQDKAILESALSQVVRRQAHIPALLAVFVGTQSRWFPAECQRLNSSSTVSR